MIGLDPPGSMHKKYCSKLNVSPGTNTNVANGKTKTFISIKNSNIIIKDDTNMYIQKEIIR